MTTPTPPGPREPRLEPTTGLLFARGILRTALFAGILRLVSYLRQDGLDATWAILSGALWGYWDMTRTYRRPVWRRAVSPEQMLGLGTAGLICLAAIGAWTLRHPDISYRVPRMLAVAIVAILPISLLRMAWGEYRRRRQPPEQPGGP